MSRISTRYAPHLLALIALASIPAYLHATGRSHQDDCAHPAGLGEEFDFDTPHPVTEATKRLNRNKIQWTEGEIDVGDPDGTRLEFTVARSFRPTSLRFGFEKLQPGYIEPEEIETRRFEIDGETVEMQFLIAKDQEPVRMGASMMIYNHRATASPFREQLRTAVTELFTSLPPMTLYFLFGDVSHQNLAQAEARAEEWMTHAWRQYRAACAP